jgi:hypothetical protein
MRSVVATTKILVSSGSTRAASKENEAGSTTTTTNKRGWEVEGEQWRMCDWKKNNAKENAYL